MMSLCGWVKAPERIRGVKGLFFVCYKRTLTLCIGVVSACEDTGVETLCLSISEFVTPHLPYVFSPSGTLLLMLHHYCLCIFCVGASTCIFCLLVSSEPSREQLLKANSSLMWASGEIRSWRRWEHLHIWIWWFSFELGCASRSHLRRRRMGLTAAVQQAETMAVTTPFHFPGGRLGWGFFFFF